MEFLYKPDYEITHERFQAFWQHEIIDRPPVSIAFRKPAGECTAGPEPKAYSTLAGRWLDIDQQVAEMTANIANTDYLYDSLPVAWPNLGPEIFSAWCGCGYTFGEDTAWSSPVIEDWDRDYEKARLNMDHPLFKVMLEFTRKLIDAGRGRFIVGLTDLHSGGDHIAALRDPANLAIDLIEDPEYVKKALDRGAADYFAAYGVFYNMVHSAGMPTATWTPLIADGTFYIPSNDFSCMVSNAMYEEFFLPGIAQECRFYQNSIYHLDGPNALRHLDSILSIPELDAVQWVCGAGNEGYARWVEVYQRIQKAGKSLQLYCDISELGMVFETLRPEGVWFAGISGIPDRETAAAVVRRIEKWK